MHPVGSRDRAHARPAVSVVAIIPARYQSSRLPGKPLAEIEGRPMIEHVYRRAAQAPGIGRVIVATDDPRVREAVVAFGGEARLTKATHRSGTDRLAEVAADLDCDLVVNVQGDEPLIHPAAIGEAAAVLAAAPDVPMVTLRRRLERLDEYLSPHVVKVVVDRLDHALYFSRAPVPHARDAKPPRVPEGACKHIGLYAYRREFLLTLAALPPTPLELAESLEQLRALEHGYRIRTVLTPHDTIGVDTPEDLDHVRRLVAGLSTP